MARTILEIAQAAAERHATAPAPDKLFGTNNKVSRILRGAAHDVMREYLTKTGWVGASELHSTWVFATVPGRYNYTMPPDFLRIIPKTEQRGGWEMGIIGPANPQTWSRWIAGQIAITAPMAWRIRNNMLQIEPPPTSTELVTIDYISRYPVVSEIRTGDYNDSTNPLIVTAPFVARDGYLEVTEDQVVATNPDDAAYENPGWDTSTWVEEASERLRRTNPQSLVAPPPMVRRPYFTADDDLPAFEDDQLMKLGMNYHLRRGMGKDFIEAAADYEAELEMKVSTDAGGPRDFHVGCEAPVSDTVPLGQGLWMLS
ncbi:MAG: hypothetical protein AAGD43_04715 [Pseudomonadota bacterium]